METYRSHRSFGNFVPFWRYKRVRPSRMILESKMYIDKEFSNLDFVPIENELTKDVQGSWLEDIANTCKLWSALFVVAIGVGVLGALQSLIIERIFVWRHETLSALLQGGFWGYIYWIAITLVPTAICGGVIAYIEPSARGLGIARIYGYLNGVNIEGFTSIRTAAVKYTATILTSLAALPGGREEPFIHTGAVFGGSLSQIMMPYTGWRPFSIYSNPTGRRDLVTAGTVAAVSVAFGTPIGAVLFCLEEGITFWNARLTLVTFVCAVLAAFTLHVTRTFILFGTHYSTPLEHYLFFSGIEELTMNFNFSSVPIFILFGVVGASLGSLWNICFKFLEELRSMYLKSNNWKFIETIIYGLFFSILSVTLFHISKNYCVKRYEDSTRISDSKEMKLFCRGNDFEQMGIFLFQDSRYVLRSLVAVGEDGLSGIILGYGLLYHMICSILQSGTILPSGIIIPNLIIGAAWGQLLAGWIIPSQTLRVSRIQCTFLGALAQVCGTTRFTLSMGVILLESSSQINFAIPVFIIVLTAKWVGGLFCQPIFRTVAYLNSYPLIRSSLLPISSSFKATDVMSAPIISLPMSIDVNELLGILERNYHSCYPILISGKIVGVVTTRQILTLLKTNIFKPPKDYLQQQKLYDLLSYYDGYSFKSMKASIKAGKYTPGQSGTLEFEQIMNRNPYIIHENMSLRRIYNLFLSLGVVNVFVVDDTCNPIGIITKKDVARFRRLEQFLVIRTEIVPLI